MLCLSSSFLSKDRMKTINQVPPHSKFASNGGERKEDGNHKELEIIRFHKDT